MGLIRGVARTAVVAGTASAVAGRVQRRQQRKWGAQDAAAQEEQAPAQEPEEPQQADAAPPPAGAAPAASGSGDLVAQLQQLETLRQQGALTDEEFGAAKAKLLGG